MSDSALTALAVADIVDACHQESQEHREQEEGFCFELFRRALDDGDEIAWSALKQQYEGLIRGWLHGATSFSVLPDTIEELVQETLTRFWRTLGQQPVTLHERFNHVGSILSYLKRCAVATCLDWQRKNLRQEKLHTELATIHQRQNNSTAPFVEQVEQNEQLQQIKTWIKQEVHDEQERLILFLSYEQDMKPNEIAKQYPEQFATVQEVRRIKERVLKRARRSLAF